jgi:hypothetical protein
MSERLLFLYQLKPGVDPEAFEAWLRSVDAPAVRRRPTVLRYETIRVEGTLAGGPAPSYVDILEVTSVDEDQRLAGGPDGEAIAQAWLASVSDYAILRGSSVERYVRGEDAT